MIRTLFAEEHDLFREAARGFIGQAILPSLAGFRERRGVDRELWIEAGRHDLLGLAVPTEYGGVGLDDFRFNVVLTEELARVALALASSLGIQTDVVAPYLLELTTPEQKQRWLPGVCTGELVTAIAMTEPGAGSDLAAMRTTAVPEGDEWVLTGSKTFITNGCTADLILVAARSGPGRRDITLFVVESEAPGFARGRKLEKLGQHEADTGELFFESVRLGKHHVLGEVGRGFGYMMERLSQERLHVACMNLAHATAALEETLGYVKERQAFGQPIGTFQHNRFLLAEMATELEVAQVYIDRCIERHLTRQLSSVDAAKAKWWSSDAQNRIIDACLQLHGGYGYMLEYSVARAWADARITKIWAGSNEIMKEIIGRSMGLGDPEP